MDDMAEVEMGLELEGDMTSNAAPPLGTYDSDEEGNDRALLPGAAPSGPAAPKSAPLWSLAFYQAYFDVDTGQVLTRLRLGALPFKSTLMSHMHDHGGDLYGPFWVSTTLIFVLAVAGNLAHYRATPQDKRDAWHYNFSKVSVAATVIYSYASLVPFALWLWLRIKVPKKRPNMFDVFCLYGYSLAPYAPVSLLCAFPFINALGQWILLSIVLASSTVVMMRNLVPYLRELPNHLFTVTAAVIVLANIALCVAFKFYFLVN